jgi:polar amino acid transport system substrate-binding protein
LVVNGFTDTEERRKRMNFVDYFQGGSEIYVPAGNPQGIKAWDDLCGRHVGVLKASLEVTHAEEQSEKCTSQGQSAVEISVFPIETATILALRSGRSDAMLMDSPVGGYVAKESNGAFEAAGAISESKRKGIVVSKENEELMLAVQQAVQMLMDDGTYLELLKKWGLEDGAIEKAIINDGTGY